MKFIILPALLHGCHRAAIGIVNEMGTTRSEGVQDLERTSGSCRFFVESCDQCSPLKKKNGLRCRSVL